MGKALFTKNVAEKKVVVERVFHAPREKVWQAWTQSDLLDQWWGPAPYKAITKRHEFTVGGEWFYNMAGPHGEEQWCGLKYLSIDEGRSFSGEDYFADADGNPIPDMPMMHWEVVFEDVEGGTKMVETTTFKSEEDMQKITDMGFEQGFSQGLDQLAALVEG